MLLALPAAAHPGMAWGGTSADDAIVEQNKASDPLPEREMPIEDRNCLAEAVFFEAGSEPVEGQLAVAHVILNRTKSDHFPKTVCGVVRQNNQFSYQRRTGAYEKNPSTRANARAVADRAISGWFPGVASRALYFHNSSVNPSWIRRFKRVAQIGRHVFYAMW